MADATLRQVIDRIDEVAQVASVHALQVVRQLLVGSSDEHGQRAAREVAVLVIDHLNARTIDRQQLPSVQIQLPAQQHELPEHLPEGRSIDAAEIGNGPKIRLQVPQQRKIAQVASTLATMIVNMTRATYLADPTNSGSTSSGAYEA
jgi:hypothetical protein